MTNPEPLNLASNALGKKRVLNDTQNDLSLLLSPFTAKRRKISKKKKSKHSHSSSSSNTNHTSTNIEFDLKNNKNSSKNEINIKNISAENKSESLTISSNSNSTKNNINEVMKSNPFSSFMNNGWTKTQKTKHIKEYLYCRPIPPLNLSKLNDMQKQELRSAFEILDDEYMNDILNKHSSKSEEMKEMKEVNDAMQVDMYCTLLKHIKTESSIVSPIIIDDDTHDVIYLLSSDSDMDTNGVHKINENCMSLDIIQPSTDPNVFYNYLHIFTDERCLLHTIDDEVFLEEFNEQPKRLQVLMDMIVKQKWNERCHYISELEHIPTLDEIEGLHTAAYLQELQNQCSRVKVNGHYCSKGSDTYICRHTLKAAQVSAGLVMNATKIVLHENTNTFLNNGTFDLTSTSSNDVIFVADVGNINIERKEKENENEMEISVTPIISDDEEEEEFVLEGKKAYAVVLNRPPGHHCDGEKYTGYCFINSTAVAIEKHLNADTKVLILDIDVHHGDGTQHLFYSTPNVLTVSFHQYDGHFYPVSGLRSEYGPSRRHPAYGTNINIPLTAGATDYDVLYALRKLVWHVVKKYKPKIAFYAVGTDGISGDKANNSTKFTPNLYGQIAYELTKYVNMIVVTTEGGYTTKYLSRGLSSVLHGLTHQMRSGFYPESIPDSFVSNDTMSTVASTQSDLRKTYDFKMNASEMKKIFCKTYEPLKTMSTEYYPSTIFDEDLDSDIYDPDPKPKKKKKKKIVVDEELKAKIKKRKKAKKHALKKKERREKRKRKKQKRSEKEKRKKKKTETINLVSDDEIKIIDVHTFIEDMDTGEEENIPKKVKSKMRSKSKKSKHKKNKSESISKKKKSKKHNSKKSKLRKKEILVIEVIDSDVDVEDEQNSYEMKVDTEEEVIEEEMIEKGMSDIDMNVNS